MTQYGLTALLLISSIPLFSQPIQRDRAISTLNEHQVRAILKDHAELEMLREVRRIDSISYANMVTAYYFKDSAYQAMTQAQQATHESAQAYAELYHNSDKTVSGLKKEVRRQKRLRILTMVGAGVIVLLTL